MNNRFGATVRQAAIALFGLAFALLWGPAGTAQASLITVDWAADSSVDGTGTGVLGGANTVTYTTAVGFNAGLSFPESWPSYMGTGGATGGSVTFETGGVLGGAGGGTTETITFSATVVNPVLLVNFLGGPPTGGFVADAFDFGINPFTVLSSFNATASGNTVSSTTSVTDSADDGFGIQFNGTFGPGSPLQFIYESNGRGPNGLQTVAFTVGVTAVPEPSILFLFLLGAAGLAANNRYRRKFGA